jgi:hypothetical protein
MEHDLEKAINIMLILSFFEQLSRLKINFHKNEIFGFRRIKDEEEQYKQLLGCESGSLPFKYLGVPIYYRKLRIPEWYSVESHFEIKLGCWQVSCYHTEIGWCSLT